MKVSVMVFAYNNAQFIRQALDSILAQKTDFDYEVFVSEDCSTDGTREIVMEYADAHPKIVHAQLSPVNFRDTRIAERFKESARGEYIALMDGDDFWTSTEKLQRQVQFMELHPEYSVSWHYQEFVDSEGRPIPNQEEHSAKTRWSLEDYLQGNPIGTSSAMLRTSMSPKLPDWFDKCAFRDFPLFALFLENGPGGYLDESLGAYRVHAGGLYSGLDDLTQKLLYQRTFRHVYHHIDPSLRAKVAKSFARRWATIGYKQSLKGDWPAARMTAKEAQQDFPHDMRLKLLARFPMLYPPFRTLWIACKHVLGQSVQDEG